MDFELQDFLPYLLNRAAERSSKGFQDVYKKKYGMLRTEWRVLFHLGRYEPLTAQEICRRGDLHKTKVSRAVTALELKRFVVRKKRENDRRFEDLSLTLTGKRVYADLEQRAAEFHKTLTDSFSNKETELLIRCLRKLSNEQEDRQR